MNRLMKLVSISAMALWASAAMAKDVTEEYKVDGWSCGSCANKTTAEVKKVNGVKDVKTDVKASTLTVTYDDAVAKSEVIAEAVKKAGYACSIKDQKKS